MRNSLGAKHFLDRLREKLSGFDGRVVGNDHARPPVNGTDARHNARGRNRAPPFVHAIGGPETQFKKRGIIIKQSGQTLAHRQTAQLFLPLVTDWSPTGVQGFFLLQCLLGQCPQ